MTNESKEDPMRNFSALLLLLFSLCFVPLAHAEFPWPDECEISDRTGEEKDITLTCMPDVAVGYPEWNHMLVVYAHGYVPPQASLALPEEELTVDYQGVPTTVPAILMSQGFAFATTSYSKNGYAVESGGDDLNALVAAFKVAHPQTGPVLIVGASEGALIATMLLERFPQIYAGGLAIAGPLAGMPYQIKYLGDFRVVFDYFFFPSVLPGPFGERDEQDYSLPEWDELAEKVTEDIVDDFAEGGDHVRQLFQVTRAAQDPSNPQDSALETALSVLRYSILGKNDLLDTANGQPFNNRQTLYLGADDNLSLNLHVERVKSDKRAEKYVEKFYKPTGYLQRPLVTIHNMADGVVPFRHELLYWAKALFTGSGKYLTVIPVPRYGHAALATEELLYAFGVLVTKVTN